MGQFFSLGTGEQNERKTKGLGFLCEKFTKLHFMKESLKVSFVSGRLPSKDVHTSELTHKPMPLKLTIPIALFC